MNTHRKLWKVVPTHQMGAQAPTFFVETRYVSVNSKSTKENKEVEELQALKKAKSRTRLSDFPDKWTIRVYHLENRVWNSKRNKWWKDDSR